MDSLSGVDAIFRIAFSIEAEDIRAQYLRQACGGNRVLHDRVMALLQAQEDKPDFLESPPTGVAATIGCLPISERPGTQIGPYKLIEEIGNGGMGVVYMALQREPVGRKVALKIIKPGMDTREVIGRFRAEEQALAMMDHPNIAKVHDAGATDSGRPYFVMELVNGVRITQFCDDNRLSTRKRLELFVSVCNAVQHAHQKGVIHRDIKPSNILVTLHDGVTVPKIIDFGIAKAISQELALNTVVTGLGQMLGTPLYMSPEQAERSGLDVDTRGDVYSLGVLLYELLTGLTPFDREKIRSVPLDEIRRIIREDEPPRPSTRVSTLDAAGTSTISQHRGIDARQLSNLLRGELDWIVMKALEKDRSRRYESANDFARDVQRFLDDEPVAACPPTPAYRLSKFARRNKTLLTATALVALALVVGTGIASWQAVRAHNEAVRANQQAVRAEQGEKLAAEQARRAEKGEQRAEQERKKAVAEAGVSAAVLQFLNDDLLGPSGAAMNADPDITLHTVLDRAAATISDRFQDQPLVAAKIHTAIGQAYQTLGGWSTPTEDRSKPDCIARSKAMQHYKTAYDLLESELGPAHPDTLMLMNTMAHAYEADNLVDEARRTNERALKLSQDNLGFAHPTTLTLLHNQIMFHKPGDAMWLQILEETLKLGEDQLGPGHSLMMVARNNLIAGYKEVRRWEDSIPLLEESLNQSREQLGPNHPHTVKVMRELASVYLMAGHPDKALPYWREVLQQLNERLGLDHWETIGALSGLAIACQEAGQLDEALPLQEETLRRRIKRAKVKDLPLDRYDTLRTMNKLAIAYLLTEQPEKARSMFAQFETQMCEVLDEHSSNEWLCFYYQSVVGAMLVEQANVLSTVDKEAALKKFNDAEPLLITGYEGMAMLQTEVPAPPQHWVPEAQQRLVDLYTAWGKPDEAAKWRERTGTHNSNKSPDNVGSETRQEEQNRAKPPD